MLVTVFCAPRDRPETTFALDVSPDLELRDFVALCELESGIPAGEIQITYVEQPLKDPVRALGTYGIKDGDVVVLRQADRRPPQTQPSFPGLPHIDFRSIAVPGASSSTNQRAATRPQQQAPPQPRPAQPATSTAFPQGLDNPALLQQMLLSNPHELSLLKERNPPLAEALLSGDLERFTKVLMEQQQDRAKREQERIKLLTADPFDLEAQAKIEEDIRQHNVEENMTIAMEEAPESFGQVVMLYINCKVNGHPVKAFVDSGAQMTIMSQACAERCNIMRLVDRRWAGIAKGVGTQKIIGRVHLAQVQIEGDFLPCSFSILEDQPMDMLLGLDMLKRHQCSIDLKKSFLIIGTTGTETRFLSEAELPECARLAYGAEGREDARPEEIADRELAEALQRSIQESDTADGQTTSPQPPPFTLPRPLMPSPSIPSQSTSCGPLQNQNQDCSQPAPAALQKVSKSGLPEVPQPLSQTNKAPLTQNVQPHRMSAHSNNNASPPPSSSSDVARAHTESQDIKGERKVESNEVENPIIDTLGESSSNHPMDQEGNESEAADTTVACPAAPVQPESMETESPPSCDEALPTQRDRSDGERCSSSDSIPSLAAALKELHELLVSNNSTQSQNLKNNCASSCAPGQDLDRAFTELSIPTPEKTPSAPKKAEVEPNHAKASCATAVLDKEPSPLHADDLAGQEDLPGNRKQQVPHQCPHSSHFSTDDKQEENEACNISVSPDSALVPEVREPPEGQHGRGIADGEASHTDTQETPQSEPAFVSSADIAQEVSSSSSASAPLPVTQGPQPSPSAPLLPSPHPFTDRFPAEHIQRIQAAGFSAREAVEALERAHGVVELALLALLARSITVPT